MTSDELKARVAVKAADYLLALPAGSVIGVGTGSTVNLFIDALAPMKDRLRGAVSSSEASSDRLRSHGIEILDLNEVTDLPIYIDGADEINDRGHMIKGGGGALTREKIVASVASQYLCIADESKVVAVLGKFPLAVEVIPMGRAAVARRLEKLGGNPTLRMTLGGRVFRTDNGCEILDVSGLQIADPVSVEMAVNQIPGVVTVGLFAERGADALLLGTSLGVQMRRFTR